jgi:hypothetical protein
MRQDLAKHEVRTSNVRGVPSLYAPPPPHRANRYATAIQSPFFFFNADDGSGLCPMFLSRALCSPTHKCWLHCIPGACKGPPFGFSHLDLRILFGATPEGRAEYFQRCGGSLTDFTPEALAARAEAGVPLPPPPGSIQAAFGRGLCVQALLQSAVC